MDNIKTKIDLFKKIYQAHLATDYSSIDHLYPPLFIWDKTQSGDKIQSGEVFKNLLPSAKDFSLYAHFPFCRYKCNFCRQFSIAVNEKKRYQDYIELLMKELRLYAPYFRHLLLGGVWFGGGTPTLFDLERLLREIYKNFNLHPSFYLNIESTPDSLDRKKMANLKKLGLTRLLIGVQSFDPRVLNAIGRFVPQKKIFGKIYEQAVSIGIPYINIELVCGLPQQTTQSFIEDLKYIISLKPSSIHIYPFSQTPLTSLGRTNPPPDIPHLLRIRKIYKTGWQILVDAGYSYRGDDFAIDDTARNPALDISQRFSHRVASLGLGLSAMGFYYFSHHPNFLETFNTLNFKKYAEMIGQNLFPIERFYRIGSKDEKWRRLMIIFYRYGGLSNENFQHNETAGKLDVKKLYSRFEKEFSFLKKAGKVTIDGSFSAVKFERKDWPIYSKIFYSQKVLNKCQKVLNSGLENFFKNNNV